MKTLNFLVLAVLVLLTSCKAKASSITPNTPCPTCVTPSSPSPLVWKSTQEWTAPLDVEGSSLDNPALFVESNDAGTANYSIAFISGAGIYQSITDQDVNFADARSYLSGAGRNVGLIFRAISGTAASPSATTSGQTAGLTFRGYGTANTSARAVYEFGAGENWSGSAQGTYHAWQTTANGTTTTNEKMRLTGDGRLGIGTSSPSTPLHVIGAGTFSGDVSMVNLTASGNAQVTGNVQAGWNIASHNCGAGVSACTATCPNPTAVLGGGCQTDNTIKASYPDPGGAAWNCNTTSNAGAFIAYAVCARIAN